jgi:Protein of unknown function (DUF3892)
VVGIEKELTNLGGAHAHVAALCLEDGRRLTKAAAMARLRAGIDRFHIDDGGRIEGIEIVERCPQCGRDFLRTDPESVSSTNLLRLPDC